MILFEGLHHRPPFLPIFGKVVPWGVLSSTAASSFFDIDTTSSGEWYYCLHPLDMLVSLIHWGWKGPVSVLCQLTCSWVATGFPNMVASGTLPVKSCKGYIIALWVSGRQGHRATTKASTNAL